MASENPKNPTTTSLSETPAKNHLIAQRTGQRGSVTKLLNKIPTLLEAAETPKTKLLTLQDHYSQIENKLSGLQQICHQILQVSSDSEIQSLIDDHEEYESRTRDVCLKLRLEIASLKEAISNPCVTPQVTISPIYPSVGNVDPTVSPTILSSQPSFQPSAHKVSSKLPKLSLQTFDGQILNWKKFWDSFSSEIHANPSLSPITKLNYLRSLLGPEPARVIEGLSISNDSYEKAITLLRNRYGQEHKLAAAYMRAFHSIPSPSTDLYSFRQFYDSIESYIRSLETLGKTTDSYGELLVPTLLDKLSSETREALRRENRIKEWTLDKLREALLNELEMREENSDEQIAKPGEKKRSESIHKAHTAKQPAIMREFQTASALLSSSEHRKKTPQCAFCSETHYSTDCTRYKKPEERLSVVRDKKLCFNCLASEGHNRTVDCPSKGKCRKCGRRHHTSLHTENQAPKGYSTPSSSTSQPIALFAGQSTTPVTVANSLVLPDVLLQTARAKAKANGKKIMVNILFDGGAQASFVTERVAKELNCKIRPKEIRINAMGANSAYSPGITKIFIRTRSGGLIAVKAHVMPVIATSVQTHTESSLSRFPYLDKLPLAHRHPQGNFIVDVLIGADYYWKFVGGEIIRGPGPVAIQSKLGYILSGPLPALREPNTLTSLLIMDGPPAQDPLERFWDLETIGISSKSAEDSTYVEDYLNSSITFKNGRYSVKLPWKRDHPTLPNNYDVAYKRTKALVHRLAKANEPNLLQDYDKILTEQLTRGVIEETSPTSEQMALSHFLPHRPVLKSSSSTPIRIVYDCSCRASPGLPSLNDCLETGPPLQKDLCGILIRFRLSKFAVMADIEKAFHQIELDESERNFLSFLWPKNPRYPNSPMRVFRFRVVIFGATSSPFILNAVINHHLRDKPDWEVKELANALYVDNVLASFPSEVDVLSFYQSSRATLEEASMNLRNWITNSKSLHELLPTNEKHDFNADHKALGLVWNPGFDTLKLATTLSENSLCTKRAILQTVASIYDPLGFTSPVTIRAKILLQELWKEKLDWDDHLTPNLKSIWDKILKDLKIVCNFTIPRNVAEINNSPISLHVFADASPLAYGAVAYLVDKKSSILLMSRTRVAPLKPISLARLELMAILIASRLSAYLIDQLNVPPLVSLHTYMWTDSKIALCWVLNNRSKDTFILNRVTSINQIRSQHTITLRYCSSQEYPADLLTRGITASNLLSNDMWKFGPEWLLKPAEWPAETTSMTTHMNTNELPFPDQISIVQSVLQRTSSWDKALRVIAYSFRFIHNLRNSVKRKEKSLGSLTPAELQSSEFFIIREVQKETYSKEIEQLKEKDKRSVNSLISQLDLFLDNRQIIRCKGRIINAPLDYDAVCPILISKKSAAAKLLMKKAHLDTLHSGINATVSHLRKSYWIPSARQIARSITSSCVTCKKVIGNPYPYPPPPPLPKDRLQPFNPFQVTGVDFAGPLFVKLSNKQLSKCYICLFTCAVTRAVHLELLPNMDVTNFLMGFRRFVSRKTLPSVMLSDNALTFESVAKDFSTLANDPELRDFLANTRVEWKFIPKRAPWFGGIWERLVGLTKTTLKKVLGRRQLTFEELATVLTEVEAILNDRPLTYVSSSLNDDAAITPSLLLFGKRTKLFPALPQDKPNEDIPYDEPESLSRLAKYRREAVNHFWNRWISEYLTSLREFHKVKQKSFDNIIQVGDIVHVHSEEKRINWKLAKVIDLIRGLDGHARTAIIQTQHGVTNRPVNKLYPLEVCRQTEEAVPDETDHTTSRPSLPSPPTSAKRLPRSAALKAKENIKTWTAELSETFAGPAGCHEISTHELHV